MELRGSQTQIVKSSYRTRQSKAHTNQCNPSLSLELTTKMWRRHHLMLVILSPDSTLCMYLESLLIYITADGNMTGQPIVHMHILHTSKEEMSHTKEGGQPSRRLKVTQRMSNWHSSRK